MKQTILLLIAITLGLNTIAQTIRIADNNANRPTGANIYATIQAAVDAAVANDIVYVQPSPTSYGNVTINKKITLRGIGFGFATGQPFNSTVGIITLTNRSDNTSNASGTVLEGLAGGGANINLGTLTGGGYTLQNITISNCYNFIINRSTGYQPADNITIQDSGIQLTFFGGAGVSNLLVRRNYLFTNFYMVALSATNVIVSNNIFVQAMLINFSNSTIVGGILANNIFLGGTNPSGSRLATPPGFVCCTPTTMTDFLVTNNIFYGCAPNTNGSGFERNTFTNNISVGTTNNALPPAGTGTGNTGSGNIVGQDPLFVNAPFGVAYTGLENFNLQALSPAKNAGFDLTDMGITGGGYPVTAGNIVFKNTAIPVITVFTPVSIVPQNQPVKANIKAKSN